MSDRLTAEELVLIRSYVNDLRFTDALMVSNGTAFMKLLATAAREPQHEAEIARLLHSQTRRWNIERGEGGILRICDGDHGKSEGCQFQDWVRSPSDAIARAETAEAALAALRAKVKKLNLVDTAGLGGSGDAIDWVTARCRCCGQTSQVRGLHGDAVLRIAHLSDCLVLERDTWETHR